MTARTFGRLMIAPAAALFVIVGTGPLLYALYASAHSFPAEADAAPEFRGFGNYLEIWTQANERIKHQRRNPPTDRVGRQPRVQSRG